MPAANITIKKKTGVSEYTELYPTTIISQVSGLQTALDGKISTTARGAANGVASLDSAGLIPANQLGTWVRGGIKIAGTMGQEANNTLGELIEALESIITNSSGVVQREELVGYAFVAANDFELTLGTLPTNTVNFGINPGDEGDTNLPITFETGDILMVSNYVFTSPDHNYSFAVINNTYGVATTSSSGIVQLSNSTSTATTGNNVVTDGILGGLLATANTSLSGSTNANKLAPAAHHHDSLYLGINSNATSASQWATARTVTFATGTVTGSFAIDGTADVTNVALTYTGNEFYYAQGDANVGDLVFETDAE